MKRLLGWSACGALAMSSAVLSSGVATASAEQVALSAAQQQQLALGVQIAPKSRSSARPAGPNPYLSIVTDPAAVDYSGWRTRLAATAELAEAQRDRARAAAPSALADAAPPVLVDELEPDTVSAATMSRPRPSRCRGSAPVGGRTPPHASSAPWRPSRPGPSTR